MFPPILNDDLIQLWRVSNHYANGGCHAILAGFPKITVNDI